MTTPTSVPNIAAQPDDAYYPLNVAYLFRDFDRAGYQAAFGIDAPSYDPHRRPKAWFDTSVQGNDSAPVTYNYIDSSSPDPQLVRTLTMTVAEARTVNLPGVQTYPKYVVAPSGAAVTAFDGTSQPINPNLLATFEEAGKLVSLWGLPNSAIEQASFTGGFTYTYPLSEPRRYLLIRLADGTEVSAAAMIQQMYAQGVGVPGHWDLSGPVPRWFSELPTSIPVTLPPMPRPIRALLPNEAIAAGLFGSIVIYRMDKDSVYNARSTSEILAAHSQLLARIDANVQAILAKLPAIA